MSERLGRFPSDAIDSTDQSQVVCVVWAGPEYEAMLELVVEASFEAKCVPWFVSGYHGMLWIFGLGPSWLCEVLDSRTWFDHETSCS